MSSVRRFFPNVFAISTYYWRLKHFLDERREKATEKQRMRGTKWHRREYGYFGEERLINCDWHLAFLSKKKVKSMLQSKNIRYDSETTTN